MAYADWLSTRDAAGERAGGRALQGPLAAKKARRAHIRAWPKVQVTALGTKGGRPADVIAGADLRWELMEIVGWLFLAMGATATVVVALLPSATPRALWYAVPYGLGVVVAYEVLPIIGRYY